MQISYASSLPVSVDEAFAWHARPGAMTRLLPPWQPVRAVRESQSLASGRAELRLGPGLSWQAKHRPEDFRPGRGFVDELTPEGLRAAPLKAVNWRHEHLFSPIDQNSCQLEDRITTNLPRRFVEPMLHYRHRVLADDLLAHRRAAEQGLTPRVVAISGASGMIGSALTAFLRTGGHRVIELVRRAPRHGDERQWTPDNPAADLLEGCDAVIHLAGANIFGRFTDAHRKAIAQSRIEPTRRLASCAEASGVGVFISASGIAAYPQGDEPCNEHAPQNAEGFLAQVVRDWEAAARTGESSAMRRVQIRTGLVQTPQGGMLKVLRPIFSLGAGGPIADGSAWQPWIALDDLLDIYHRALWDESLAGPVNASAPHPVRQREYARVLAQVLHRPAIVPVPAFAPKLVLGDEGADQLALASIHAVPGKLLEAGHRFRFTTLRPALEHLLGV
ncbi:TIGR01777 family oxidoreductase [Glutamicibacter sp. PS]|uniref:TIGR01777 family oxidoreductase n=1 Tax=Glutamicibacter sp. PS TaxID=3075634 RepID=UPI002850DA94|nr:TIGR01777 family oxidoreductase [Glutamicibacter sp. PS]MDR4534767.1 TIGR01777 family oxidoreductase [Glutamicibacter sp. PS]